MQLLKDKILAEGQVIDRETLKVDQFLNHQIDVDFLNKVVQEFHRLFKEISVTKILTVEASGIAVACATAQYFNVPVIFAKKGLPKNIDGQTFSSQIYSFTHNRDYNIRVAKGLLSEEDRILIIDDFLANGSAVKGLIEIVRQSGAEITGVGIVIEKGFQEGGTLLRGAGLNLKSLVMLESMEAGEIVFA